MTLQSLLKRLLVVEDDPDQTQSLCDRLKLYGYNVACADDGRPAIEMLRANSFDGLVLDLNLPTVQGDAVLMQARLMYPNLPVLILSASRSRMRAVKESEPGACSFILKPYSIGELKEALRSAFGLAPPPGAALPTPLSGYLYGR